MIYLTFDSNIWIYLLDDSWKDENPLDYLEYWIEQGHITILIPEIVLEEWKKHREKEKENRKKKLREFFNAAEEILPSTAFIGDQKKPENIEKIVEKQIKRIEDLVNSKGQTLICSSDTKLKIYDWGILKKAPLHKKSSVADAVIVFSAIEFAKNNSGNEFFFVTNNIDDFCDKDNGKIHGDLQEDFDQLNILYYRYLNHLISDLRKRLPVTIDLELRKRKRLNITATDLVYNPQLIKSLSSSEDAYLENIKMIDLILENNNPTAQQIATIFGLIQSSESYKSYFFKNVRKAVWYNILANQNLFAHDKNPGKVAVAGGFQFPFWEILQYLEKISNDIREGENLELVEKLIEFVRNISQNPVDNYRTWTVILRILTNLPNDRVSKDLLGFIPTWLTGEYDNMLVTIGLCEGLLPKFLNENPSIEDIEKAEIILNYLFEIHRKEKVDETEQSSYYSKTYLHFLKQEFVEKKLASKVGKYCSSEIILKIGRNIKIMLLDYREGVNSLVKVGDVSYEVKVLIENKDLKIKYRIQDVDAWQNGNIVPNFEELSEQEIEATLKDELNQVGIIYTPADNFDDISKRVNFAINSDLTSLLSLNSISDLDDQFHHGEKILEVFALIFRELINEKMAFHLDEGRRLIEKICYNSSFRIPFFRRIALYIISRNWEGLKEHFFALIKNDDEAMLFSTNKYSKDLFELLSRNQTNLTENEKLIINNIIEAGPKKEDKEYPNYWKLKWYSSLKDVTPFSEKYLEFSEKENITKEHFENLGVVKIRSGSIAPITIDDIMKMSSTEIYNYIKSFAPSDSWEGPSIDGLADVIGKATLADPQKFANDIEQYLDIPYLYIYHILNSLTEAVRKRSSFNRQKVLNFCASYIDSPDFYSEKLAIKNSNGWNANSEWVIGSIANFITECTQKAENELKPEAIPIVKKICLHIVKNLQPVRSRVKEEMDYISYSFNSTTGKSLRALLDYALWRARILTITDTVKWEEECRNAFDDASTKEIIDVPILEGLYYSHFRYLDQDWITKQIQSRLDGDQGHWKAFASGLVFSDGGLNFEYYSSLIPHYQKIIEESGSKSITSGLVRQLTAFYFYRFEDLNDEGLIKQFINTAKASAVSEFVTFIWQQEVYYLSLSGEEKSIFEGRIKELWEYLLQKFSNSEKKNDKDILGGLIHFVVFIPQLNTEYQDLLLQSLKFVNKKFMSYHFIEDILKLVEREPTTQTAIHLAPLIDLIPFNEYITDFEAEPIKKMVRFLYQYDQKKAADAFCHKISSRGNDFLKSLYDEFQ